MQGTFIKKLPERIRFACGMFQVVQHVNGQRSADQHQIHRETDKEKGGTGTARDFFIMADHR